MKIQTRHPQPKKTAEWAPEVNDEIVCPLTGEVVSISDVDALADMYERLDKQNKRLYAAICRVRNALADLTEGDAATRRLRGKRRQVKVTMPSVKFEQSVLKALWESHPDLAHEFMRISQVDVKLREFNKLENMTSDDPAFVYFRDTLTKACRGRDGLPNVAVEEIK